MDTPVVFMVFNRPEVSAKVLERIREAAPPRLTVVSDGPRPGHPHDEANVAATRALIEERVDWPCDLHRDYADANLGCGPRVASGLTSAFERYDRAIVLEDDTLPEPSFFAFCETMLDRYADDPSVMHVSGTNGAVGRGALAPRDAYRLSGIPDIWGWASWSRAWRHYDFGIEDWGEVRQTDWIESIIPLPEEQRIFRGAFDIQYERHRNPQTWDWSWIYTAMRRGRTVTPMRNLVTNLGFGIEATNSTSPDDELSRMPTTPIDVAKLDAPEEDPTGELDRQLLAHRFGGNRSRRHASLLGRLSSGRLLRKAKRLWREYTSAG